ncbi:MAG: dicarboxylate transporter, DctP subunit [Ramlibacter sp.]|nr:dicarboxylate transporter, DctP subunit [Ramlibacter sp.]
MRQALSKLFAAALSAAALTVAVPAQAQIRSYDLKAGTNLADDHPQSQGAKKFAEAADRLSGGKIKIRVFSAGALGSDVQMQSALQGGILDFTVPSTSTLAGQVKEFGVFDFPFLFNTAQEADQVLDGPFGKRIADKLPEKGLVSLGYWENGFRNTTNSKHPVLRWEDFQGLKIRTVQNTVVIDIFNNFGANAVPMAFNELFTALETRTVDAQENPLPVIATAKFYEVQKYLSLTRHSYTALVFLISKKTWDRFNDAEKKVILTAADEAKLFQRRTNRELDARLVEQLKKEGMQVNDVQPAERIRMAEKAKSVIAKHSGLIGEATMKELFGEIAKARASAK